LPGGISVSIYRGNVSEAGKDMVEKAGLGRILYEL
jgi:hypothetical protein